MIESQKIVYKYDLMHRNTPKFARTTIQWDTKLMTPRVRKKVIAKLKNCHISIGSGDAGDMYRALADKFELPDLAVSMNEHNTWVSFKGASQEILDMVQEHLTLEVTQHRLEGQRYWGNTELKPWERSLHFRKTHDFEPLKQKMQEFMASEEPARRVRDALLFLEDGGVLTFTYNPTDR